MTETLTMSTTVKEPKITKDLIAAHGVTEGEYARICDILGREPNYTELGIFSVMWSEHCSYKNSRPVLKLFPRDGKNLIVKVGEENAGVVDIGEGFALVFKIESHNHPSAVEPFQGAATGVGGIIRDIFTMGARPVVSMNSLRFGSLEKSQNKHYLRGVVGGIAHYGNCIGIPTIGGEIYFDEMYEGNPLVNAFCLGIMKTEDLVKGAATGAGNPVYYVGAATGRDGLGGAAFASRELTEASQEDRPAVQVGDPFMEKLLLEACLELAKSDAIVGMQDMGAAGLTCSTCETAARGNVGVEIDLAKVPKRETGMIPYETMLSESQERMLVIVKKGKEKIVENIFEKWDLHAVQIGEIKEGPLMRVLEEGQLVAEIPAKSLTDEAPLYIREEKEPEYLKEVRKLDMGEVQEPENWNKTLLTLLDSPTIASKAWVFDQYDHMVRTDTTFLPGHDAGLIRIKGTKKGIAISTDSNGLYTYLDPREGGKIAVSEAARNVACVGAKPLAITNCLNFGNPMKPDIFWQFHQAIEGISEACRALGTPVTGGNVSFYNENPKGSVYPTPTIGMVGILDDIERRVPSFFQKAGDQIYLLGETRNEIGGSQYLLTIHGKRAGVPPHLDLKKEKALQNLLFDGTASSIFNSCHDVSEGGIAIALSESILGVSGKPLGCKVELNIANDVRTDAILFGESQSRVIVSISRENQKKFKETVKAFDVPTSLIGEVTKSGFGINNWIRLSSEELEHTYRNAIPRRMNS
jgi:phosphoribosylformylglycinamidine synthase subunit PurL